MPTGTMSPSSCSRVPPRDRAGTDSNITAQKRSAKTSGSLIPQLTMYATVQSTHAHRHHTINRRRGITQGGRLLLILHSELCTLNYLALIVHHKSLADVLIERTRSPLAEPRGFARIYPIPHGDDGIEVVEIN